MEKLKISCSFVFFNFFLVNWSLFFKQIHFETVFNRKTKFTKLYPKFPFKWKNVMISISALVLQSTSIEWYLSDCGSLLWFYTHSKKESESMINEEHRAWA